MRREEPPVLPILTVGLQIIRLLGKLLQSYQIFKNSFVSRLFSYGPGLGLEEEGEVRGKKQEF